VVFDRIEGGRLIRGEEHATRVFLAAGSLGSTELLLRCRDVFGTLPKLSRQLGRNWSPNANVLSMATYPEAGRVQQSVGPTISAVVDFVDRPVDGERFVIEDDGYPNVLLGSLRASVEAGTTGALGRSVLAEIEEHLRGERQSNMMVWLGAGVDAADGELRLRRAWPTPWERTLDLRWTADRSRGVVEAILAMHRRMTEATGGRLKPPVAWRLGGNLVTIHPLGGCKIGVTPETGVVDHLGQVFGYPNLYVVDGAILPTSAGRNPSHTIAALAERAAAHVT
jgi:cholesterol oxidase